MIGTGGSAFPASQAVIRPSFRSPPRRNRRAPNLRDYSRITESSHLRSQIPGDLPAGPPSPPRPSTSSAVPPLINHPELPPSSERDKEEFIAYKTTKIDK